MKMQANMGFLPHNMQELALMLGGAKFEDQSLFLTAEDFNKVLRSPIVVGDHGENRYLY